MILFYINQMSWSYIGIFIFCEFGERVTNEYIDVDNEINQLDWYLYPLRIQQFMIMTIAGSAQPVVIRGYGNCLCTRESFKNVSHKWN